MKLATLKDGTRDGRLLVVSRDLKSCALAPDSARTLQLALDHWADAAPRLQAISDSLNGGQIAGTMDFNPRDCLSPLPRAYQWVDGSAYVNHVELVRKARGAEMPPSFWTDPLMYQGGSDAFLTPTEPIRVADEAWGIDLEAEVAVVTGDVAMGASAQVARENILLLMLVNDVSLRNLIPDELAKGFGFFQSKPSSAFSPVAVTVDELGTAWDGGKLHRPLRSWVNEKKFGEPDAGVDMTFDFPMLIAHAAKTRPLTAGTIIGSGTVSNRGTDGGPGQPLEHGGRSHSNTASGTCAQRGGVGYSCLAELRSVETLRSGKPVTPFLKFGDRVRIEMLDAQGQSIFGAIEQTIEKYIP